MEFRSIEMFDIVTAATLCALLAVSLHAIAVRVVSHARAERSDGGYPSRWQRRLAHVRRGDTLSWSIAFGVSQFGLLMVVVASRASGWPPASEALGILAGLGVLFVVVRSAARRPCRSLAGHLARRASLRASRPTLARARPAPPPPLGGGRIVVSGYGYADPTTPFEARSTRRVHALRVVPSEGVVAARRAPVLPFEERPTRAVRIVPISARSSAAALDGELPERREECA